LPRYEGNPASIVASVHTARAVVITSLPIKFRCRSITLPGWTRLLPVLLMLICVDVTANDTIHASRRAAMIADIEVDILYTVRETGRQAFNPRVMQTIASIERHEFVPGDLEPSAYENRPLPIGYGQTISQPYIVALMTDFLDLDSDDVVLEVGTGSGYQAAVLSDLVKQVYSIEIIAPLAQLAKTRLYRLGFNNVTTRLADGYYGWEEHAPFDAIVVTAAAGHVPPPLIDQLRPGGRMVIPVGSRFFVQQLLLVEKTMDGKVKTRQVLPVRFVPLTGEH